MLNNFQEQFYQAMTRVKANSRAASTQAPKDDVRITEMINGVLVSWPAAVTKEPEVIDLQEYIRSRAGSISGYGINKIKAIHDSITVVK